MRIERDVPITMDDGLVLRAYVFRPVVDPEKWVPDGYVCGPFVHDDPTDRPPAIFGGKVTLHFGPGRRASVLLPVIPPKQD